nr:immunoglobulin light chain junction region [Macaca mulatta]MOW33818.1 immunoglobulin light chain junction region [Macaca mulatta]MOW34164.1 immunoglobulin light chain junction region [Macaca mulatta]MOW35938.1 immunoglobulin light chain junction region [Macaca mulatta]
CQHTYGTPLTF